MNKVKITMISILILGISFYMTNITVETLKENDSIMEEIKESQERYSIPSEDAEIRGNSITPGKKGKNIDYNKSYAKMKKYGAYNEALTVMKEVDPNISIEDNYDKYLIGGNKKNKYISLVFPVTNEDNWNRIIKFLEKIEFPITLFIDGTILEKNIDYIKKNNSYEYEILSYQNKFQASFIKTSISYLETITQKESKYCYTDKEDEEKLRICKKLKLHTIKPNYLIKKELYRTVKNNLSNSTIFSIEINNYTMNELPMTINYIKEKDYSLVNLKKLLSE